MLHNLIAIFVHKDGGFVPECIRRPEIGLDLEIFNINAAADIQERMATFNEVHFYDGTLNTNLSLEEAHDKIGMMLADIEARANKVKNLPGSSYTGGGGSSSGSGSLSLVEKRRAARKARSKRAGSISTQQAGALFNGVLEGGGNSGSGSSNSSGYGSQMGMIMEESSETGGSLINLMEDEDGDIDGDMTGSNNNIVMNEEQNESIQGLGAVDMFIDDANPLNKAVHSSLGI